MVDVIVSRPIRFQGTPEQKLANRQTHRFHTEQFDEDDFETRCTECDCKPWHAAADYPCGTEPPREVIEVIES